MGLRARSDGRREARSEHIRRKSVSDERRRPPFDPAARPSGIFFKQALNQRDNILDELLPRFELPENQSRADCRRLLLFVRVGAGLASSAFPSSGVGSSWKFSSSAVGLGASSPELLPSRIDVPEICKDRNSPNRTGVASPLDSKASSDGLANRVHGTARNRAAGIRLPVNSHTP
jgi:hypothetical protein